LALANGAGADEAAGAVAGRQPVAEVLAEDRLEQLDIVGESGQQLLALLPAERLPLARVALQEPLEPVRGRRRGGPGEQAADGVAGPHAEGDGAVGQRALRVRGDVLPGDLGQQPGLDAEEGADLVEGGGGLVDQQPVPQDKHLLAREQRERVLELLAVPAEPLVVPEGRPAGRDPLLLLGAGADEVADRLQAGRPQVGPVGVRALDRVADDHDELHGRDRLPDPCHRGRFVEVQRRALAAERSGRGGVEERLVPVALPDVLAVGERVTGAALGRRWPVGQEELRFLDRRQEQARMPAERGVQRGGPRLGNPGHQEVGQRHRLSFAAEGVLMGTDGQRVQHLLLFW